MFYLLPPDELFWWPAATLLSVWFNELGFRLLGDSPLRFACPGSQGRVAAMLQSLGRDEARAAVIGGSAHVRCEFCGQADRFTAEEVEGLFSQAGPEAPAPGALQ